MVTAPAAGVLTQSEPLIVERGGANPTFLLMVFALAVLVGRNGIGGLFDRRFDAESLGTVYGMLFTLSMLGTALGVVGFGHLFDVYQSYDVALVMAALVLTPALLVYLSLPRHGVTT